jgi:hypothetical protein
MALAPTCCTHTGIRKPLSERGSGASPLEEQGFGVSLKDFSSHQN